MHTVCYICSLLLLRHLYANACCAVVDRLLWLPAHLFRYILVVVNALTARVCVLTASALFNSVLQVYHGLTYLLSLALSYFHLVWCMPGMVANDPRVTPPKQMTLASNLLW
jgi:hypothetical protein